MGRKNLSGKSETQREQSAELSSAELRRLFDYPSIERLFDDADPQRIEIFRARLSATRENLERVIRYGRRDDAARAARAARAVQITLDFLETIQIMRGEQKK